MIGFSDRTTYRLRQLLAACLVVLAPLGLAQTASAQAVTGTIVGTVADTTGAVLPGVTVTVKQTETGFTRVLTSDSNGEFTAASIPTGTYTVSAEISGFKTVSLSNVGVGVDQRVRADVKLEVGAMTESVEIVAQTPLVQTSSSDLSTTVTEEQIKQLPLNGRNFVSLTRSIPGVLRGIPGSNIDGAGSLAWRASAAFSANGQRPRDNNYMLDGVDNNETWLQTVVIFPSVDALDEFKLQTSTYSAEFGRSLGGVVNIQIKSGSNQFHGSAYEFHRNDALDANNFFNNRAGRPKPDFKQNQFGGTLGGPIVRGKTFFFGDYQGLRINAGQTFLSTVPSMRMRNGDFSEISRVIYDPLTQQPFAGNVIPRNRFDPASANVIAQLYPEPNTAGTIGAGGQPINNYLINPTLTRSDNQGDVKVDHTLTNSNRMFFRYSNQKTQRTLPATLPHGDAGATFGAGKGDIDAQSMTFNDTHTFGSGWLNEFRFGVNQIKFFMTPIDYGTNLAAAVGIPGINLNEATSAMTQLVFQNIREPGREQQPAAHHQPERPAVLRQRDLAEGPPHLEGGRQRHPAVARDPERRHHRGQLRLQQQPDLELRGPGGGLHHQHRHRLRRRELPARLRRVEDPQPVRRRDLHRDAAGILRSTSRTTSGVTSKLTLNAGLRWDVFVPWIEVDNRQSNFDEVDRPLHRRVGRRGDQRRRGRPLPADLLEERSRSAPRHGLRRARRRPDHRPRRLRRLLELLARRHVVVEGPEPAVPAVDGADHDGRRDQPALCRTACRRLRASTRTVRSAGTTRSIFDVDFRDAYALNWNINLQQAFGAQLRPRGRLRRVAWPPDDAQGRPEPGAAGGRRDRPEPSTARTPRWSPALRSVGQAQSVGTLDYNAFLLEVPAPVRDNFSVLTSYTFGKTIDLNSDNDGAVTLTNVYDPRVQPGPVRLRREAHAQLERDLRAARRPRGVVGRLAGQRHRLLPHRAAAHDHPDAGRAVDRHRQPAEPHRRRPGGRADDRAVVRPGAFRVADRHHRHLR